MVLIDRAFCKFMIDDQNKLNTVFLFLLFPSAQLSAFLILLALHIQLGLFVKLCSERVEFVNDFCWGQLEQLKFQIKAAESFSLAEAKLVVP